MGIITVGREFGSGGRELGKRLADALNYAYYDQEIIDEIVKNMQLSHKYVENILHEGVMPSFSYRFGNTFYTPYPVVQGTVDVLVEQQKVIKEIAQKGNCIIVGKSANVILKDLKTLDLFVYADLSSKIKRCQERAPEGENFSEKELKKRIKQIDARRSRFQEALTDLKWGAKEGYHLCINTSGFEIKALIPFIAEYATRWFDLK